MTHFSQSQIWAGLSVLLIAACNVGNQGLPSQQANETNHVMVLSTARTALNDVATTFRPVEPVKIADPNMWVCLALKGGIPLQDQSKMDEIYDGLIGGARVEIDLLLGDGRRTTMPRPMFAWAKLGKILGKEQISGCSSTRCIAKAVDGAALEGVEVRSNIPLVIQGAFLEYRSQPDVAACKN